MTDSDEKTGEEIIATADVSSTYGSDVKNNFGGGAADAHLPVSGILLKGGADIGDSAKILDETAGYPDVTAVVFELSLL